MKDIVNMTFFIIALIIIFFMISTNDLYNALSPVQHRGNSPIFISPRNVHAAVPMVPIVPATVCPRTPSTSSESSGSVDSDESLSNKHHSSKQRFSPTGSVVAPSIFEVDVNYSKSQEKVVVEPTGYKFSRDGRNLTDGEELCCKIFEEYLGRRVLTDFRPNFMKNPKTKRNLELDLYDPLTKIAIEYNGIQHYQESKHFGMGSDKLQKQKENDRLKVELCKKEGVTLIVVPCFVDAYVKDKNGKDRYAGYSKEIRYEKLYNYLIPILEHIFNSDPDSI